MKRVVEPFGQHFTLDGYGANSNLLASEKLICDLLNKLPSEIGMTKISDVTVFTYHGKIKEDWGVTGFVIIAESHISIHTFPEKKFISMDIYSCKPFDDQHEFIVLRLSNAFDIKEKEISVRDRGLKFERNI